jgi:hypothetical protein
VAEPLKLRRCLDRLVFVAPIRFVLAAICLACAWADGAKQPGASAAFAFGCIGLAVVALTDRRAVLLGRVARARVPEGARFAGRWDAALSACVPSTIAVTVMSLVALIFEPTLAALLAGAVAGLGVAGLVAGVQVALQEREEHVELYVTGGGPRVLYERPTRPS